MEGKQCLLYDFSWTNIDRLTFQVNTHINKQINKLTPQMQHRTLTYICSTPRLFSFLSLLPPFPLQGSRFEIHAVGSLCLPKLVYYTPSVFHSQHILRHVSDSHQLHISIRDTVSLLRQLENMQGQRAHLISPRPQGLFQLAALWVDTVPHLSHCPAATCYMASTRVTQMASRGHYPCVPKGYHKLTLNSTYCPLISTVYCCGSWDDRSSTYYTFFY